MINERLVPVEERQRILDDLHTALVVGNYPTSANDPIMKDLQRLIVDATEKVIDKNLKKVQPRKYKTYQGMHVPSQYLKELTKENPNDADLGKKVRQIMSKDKS